MKRFLIDPRSLRVQLTARILLVMVPCFSLSYLVLDVISRREVTLVTEARLKSDANLIAYGLGEWGQANAQTLKTLTLNQDLQQRQRVGTQQLLDSLARIYPHREWRYWTTDPQPRLLAATGGNITAASVKRAEASILKREYFQEALSGNPSYSVIKSLINNSACLMFAQPVYASTRLNPHSWHGNAKTSTTANLDTSVATGFRGGQTAESHPATTSGTRPTGVLLSCLRLEQLGSETGLQAALAGSKATAMASQPVDFSRQRSLNSSLLLVSRNGHLLYPGKGKQRDIPMISDHLNGHWAPLFRIVQDAKDGTERFERVKVGKEHYFVVLNKVDNAWSTLLILNERTAFEFLRKLRGVLILVGMIGTVITSAAIVAQCGQITAPIRRAGKALQRISEGDFDTRVTHTRHDEIGTLLDNVNATSAQLKLFLDQETASAVVRKQIETAREIQKDFLVSEIPQSEHLEIAPMFKPAYEIGADWYDAVRIGDITAFVVADVCDKGIPSALYMSVFRSLLRYGLLSHLEQTGNGEDIGQKLQDVVTLANNYMATNHGESMMFATVFIGAIRESDHHLYYLSCGHEPALIRGREADRWLDQTGPAVGLFPGAAYTYGQIELEAGDYLIAYTDGLTDARSPDNQGWGRERLEHFMAERAGGESRADTVLADLLQAVQSHMAGSEPFDDLTVMVLRIVPQSQLRASSRAVPEVTGVAG